MGRALNWVRTLVAQIAICFGLYFALQLGQPQKYLYGKTSENETRPLDFYFISVRGGSRPLYQQALLLKQMDRVAKAFKARFVVNIGELGEHDPMIQNGTQLVLSRKVPWYSIRASKVHEEGGFFLKQVNLTHGKTLNIIGVNTGLFRDALTRPLNETENDQLHWLTKTLDATSGNWRVVVGFDPLVSCEERNKGLEANKVSKTLKQAFVNFEVNAYISAGNCTNHDSISYIENPGQFFSSQRSESRRELAHGFLLHRVSALELVTYFVTSAGQVVYRSALQQRSIEVL